MPRKTRPVIRALARLPQTRLLPALLGITRQGISRLARQTVQRISGPFPRLSRFLQPRQRQVVAVVKPAHVSSTAPADAAVDSATLLSRLSDPSWSTRAEAVSALAAVQGGDVTDALVASLRDSSVEVALSAIEALRVRKGENVTAALRGVFDNTDGFFNPLTRAAALGALSERLPGDEAFVASALRDADAEVSLAAIEAIQRRKASAALDLLLPIARDGTGYYLPLVRGAAVQALRGIGVLSETERDALLAAEMDPQVRSALSG